MIRSHIARPPLLHLTLSLLFACSVPDQSRSASRGAGGTDSEGGAMAETVQDDAGTTPEDVIAMMPAPPNCSNGELTPDEACDDGDNEGGDGCSANCLLVEEGFSCPRPGTECHRIARCGDGVLVLPELCDDGNALDGDGCSDTCKVEVGFKCDGAPSSCTATVCGDSILEGAESCDDGNAQPFDGCSAICQREPDCSQGACASECGDGLVLPPEACDDGNRIDGDGCAADCSVEAGFECPYETSCDTVNGECVLRVSAVFRDFQASHSDFAVSCGGHVTGLVGANLDAEGKPVLASPQGGNQACISGTESFSEWYRDGSSNRTLVSNIVLFDNGNGQYVNRLTNDGIQWLQAEEQSSTNMPCVNPGVDCVPCFYSRNQGCALTAVDGNPLFFPMNDFPDAWPDGRFQAKVPPPYGPSGWLTTDAYGTAFTWPEGYMPDAQQNFYFTSEVRYWFMYDPASTPRFDFIGDDDVWVFVNGILTSVDLGGLHVPMEGSFTIDAAFAAAHGMEAGKVYSISVFHAERKLEGSTFKLTLSGFNTNRSECRAICGDGILGLGEECDDGVNDGSYGGCSADCKLGAFCGDGILQEGEDCDGENLTAGSCSPSTNCREIELI